MVLLSLIVAAVLGCDGGGMKQRSTDAVVEFDTATLRVRTAEQDLTIKVELALSQAQQAYGLMERDSLGEMGGMLFLYAEDQPAESAFYMFRTRIPLDIAFLDAEGVVRNVQRMEPCVQPYPDLCRRYSAGVPFRAALEVYAGWFARHGVGIGDRVEW